MYIKEIQPKDNILNIGETQLTLNALFTFEGVSNIKTLLWQYEHWTIQAGKYKTDTHDNEAIQFEIPSEKKLKTLA